MTPLHIQLLLHFYAIAEPYAKHDPQHAESSAVRDYTENLVMMGLIIVLFFVASVSVTLAVCYGRVW